MPVLKEKKGPLVKRKNKKETTLSEKRKEYRGTSALGGEGGGEDGEGEGGE